MLCPGKEAESPLRARVSIAAHHSRRGQDLPVTENSTVMHF